MNLTVDGPQTYRRNNMPLQMIELEEVTMMDISDEALEALRSPQKYGTTQGGSTCSSDGGDDGGCPW